MTLSRRTLAVLLALAALVALGRHGPVATPATARNADWRSIVHPARGYAIAYPGDVFVPDETVQAADGSVLISRDGSARLLVGTFDNTGDFTIDSYRSFLLSQNYSGADIDYDRRTPRWFVISGTRGDTMFYERVTFACGGRWINSWAMLYPVRERRFYDPIVEAVARTYSPGAGMDGNCQ